MSALESRLSRLESRRGADDVERVLSLYTEEELQASIDELEARIGARFSALGIDGSPYTSMQKLAIMEERDQLATKGEALDMLALDVEALTDRFQHQSAAIREDPREQAARALEWLTQYRQKQAGAAV